MTAKSRELATPDLLSVGMRWTIRFALLGLLAIGAASAWRWREILDPITIATAISRYPAAPLCFLAVHTAASLLFVPRTLLAIVAGLLFGMGWGIVWAASGSVAGAMAGFLVARYLNSGLIDLRRLGSVVGRVERGGWRGVAVLRLVPVMPHSVANYTLGLTRLSLGAYTFGSLLGQLPMTIAYVDLGAAGERLMLAGANWVEPTLIGLSLLALSLLIPAIACRQAS